MEENIKIVNERLVDYINSLKTRNSDILEEIEEEARRKGVPIIRKEVENFLSLLIKMQKPKAILEVGAAVGYSALFMAESMPKDSCITTIELDKERAAKARENISKAGEKRINLIEGDASIELPKIKADIEAWRMPRPEMIFLDAAKGQYGNFFENLADICSEDGLIVTDNVLQEGTIIESRYMIEQRDRTIHARMRDFLYDLTHNDTFATSIVPIGDGIALSLKLRRK